MRAARLSLMKRNNFMKKRRIITHEEAKNHHSWRSKESSLNEEAKNRHSMQKRRLVRALDRSEEQLNNARETTLRSESDKSNIAKWIKQGDIAKSSQAKQSSQTRQHCEAKQTSNIAKRSRQDCCHKSIRSSTLAADFLRSQQILSNCLKSSSLCL